MLALARALQEQMKPINHPEYNPKSEEFVEKGFWLGNMLHSHGHKELPPDRWPAKAHWMMAAAWKNDATTLAQRIGLPA